MHNLGSQLESETFFKNPWTFWGGCVNIGNEWEAVNAKDLKSHNMAVTLILIEDRKI